MLTKVAISNFVIIDELEISFDKGFSAITGETGTGKSIVIDAIEFCLGRNNVQIPRKHHEKETVVTISFHLDDVSEIEKIISHSVRNDFSITRTVDFKNKSAFYIDGHLVSKKVIKELSGVLLNIVSQFSSILNKCEYLKIIDNFMLSTNPAIRWKFETVANLFHRIQETSAGIRKLENELFEVLKEKEHNLEIVKTLESIGIKENEETELLDQRAVIQKANSMQNTMNSILEILRNFPVEQKLNQVIRQLEKFNDDAISELSARIDRILIEFNDITNELQKIQEETFSSQSKIEKIDDRISLLRELGRKYNVSSSILFELLNSAKLKIDETDLLDNDLKNLKDVFQRLMVEYDRIAVEISDARKVAAERLSAKVCERLKDLNMKETTFQVVVCRKEDKVSEFGKDEVEFVANFNQKSDLMPISEIASGGEAARLNFAIKTVLALFGKPQTIIFDEIDIGIGGAAAYLMGTAMRNLEDKKIQVISITHSPQVAAQAMLHILIQKSIRNELVSVFAIPLNNEQRILEIARMISGTSINDESILAAKQLINS